MSNEDIRSDMEKMGIHDFVRDVIDSIKLGVSAANENSEECCFVSGDTIHFDLAIGAEDDRATRNANGYLWRVWPYPSYHNYLSGRALNPHRISFDVNISNQEGDEKND